MRIGILLILLLTSFFVNGQGKSILKDEILIHARSGVLARDILAGIPDIGSYIKIEYIAKITPSLNIYKISLSRIDNNGDMLEQFIKSPMVISAQYNGLVFPRRTPNDREYGRQWALRQINMPQAWDVSVGLNQGRAPIVVAILDSGVDRNHNDLLDNIWFNKDEIPGDGMDNDNNGYRDDYYGLNIKTNRDDNFEHYHGTQVAGIIGAESNNTDGIAGINWNVQLMTIALAKTGGFQFSEIIEGMGYALGQRKRYNESNGEHGAFITVLNFSLGDLGWFESSFPIICNLFTELGEAGILTVAATDNSDSNIDIIGDFPSDCKSDYLITVTNSDKMDKKAKNAGYGVIGIDIAAPGEGILSTSTDKTYKLGSGCSFAAPMVSGVISLLYSLECDVLQDSILKKPGETALMMKEAVLNSVVKSEHLDSLVLSGGRLDAYNGIQYIYNNVCGNTGSNELEIVKISPNPTNDVVVVEIKTPINNFHYIDIINANGKIIRQLEVPTSLNPTQTIIIDVQDFVCGSYYLRLYNDQEQISKQVIVCN